MGARALSHRIVLLGAFVAVACHVRGAQDVKVDPGVREVLGREGIAHVMVALVPPAGAGTPDVDAAATAAAIAAAQDRVLAGLDTADFRVRLRFRNVPAIAGSVRTARALEILSGHPEVRRIDLDPAGGGVR